jgi:hypothetical protein
MSARLSGRTDDRGGCFRPAVCSCAGFLKEHAKWLAARSHSIEVHHEGEWPEVGRQCSTLAGRPESLTSRPNVSRTRSVPASLTR